MTREWKNKSTEYKATQILPRRRGSGSGEAADEGVETRGKAENRKKKAEITKSCAMSNGQLPPH
ncbi:MAG: hypothetical protein IJB60_01555 [Bacteroidaceae bacterium]|nr:hypothetical protein [Bacteroidaceae bacterium]